jgi:hypothetical protein
MRVGEERADGLRLASRAGPPVPRFIRRGPRLSLGARDGPSHTPASKAMAVPRTDEASAHGVSRWVLSA